MMRNMVNSKYILSCLSAFVLAICTCASACLHSDGFICSKKLKAETHGNAMEYFYCNGKDTSAISFIYDSVRGKGITIDVMSCARFLKKNLNGKKSLTLMPWQTIHA